MPHPVQLAALALIAVGVLIVCGLSLAARRADVPDTAETLAGNLLWWTPILLPCGVVGFLALGW